MPSECEAAHDLCGWHLMLINRDMCLLVSSPGTNVFEPDKSYINRLAARLLLRASTGIIVQPASVTPSRLWCWTLLHEFHSTTCYMGL